MDIDRYKGHTPGSWAAVAAGDSTYTIRAGRTLVCENVLESDKNLIVDAPFMLGEIERLTRKLDTMRARIAELENKLFEEFQSHLKDTANEVRAWPHWKLLGGKASMGYPIKGECEDEA